MIYLSIRDNYADVFDNVSGTGARRIFSEGAQKGGENRDPRKKLVCPQIALKAALCPAIRPSGGLVQLSPLRTPVASDVCATTHRKEMPELFPL